MNSCLLQENITLFHTQVAHGKFTLDDIIGVHIKFAMDERNFTLQIRSDMFLILKFLNMINTQVTESM